TRYVDESALLGQAGGGFRHCLPTRPPVALPASRATLLPSWPNEEPEVFNRFFDNKKERTIKVSNQLLASDSTTWLGVAAELGRALDGQTSIVKSCVTSAEWTACEIELRGTFTKPLIGLRPTNKTGTLHMLVVADL